MYIDFLISFLSYFGFFIAGIVSSATILVPFPLPIQFSIIFAPKLGLNPFIAAIFMSIGATIGETTSYFVGQGLSLYKWNEIKKNKLYQRISDMFLKYGDVVLVFYALTPLPFDFMGIMCGFLRYSIRKFIIITSISKTGKLFLIAYLGEKALEYLKW